VIQQTLQVPFPKSEMEPRSNGNSSVVSSPVDEMLLAALERGDDSLETGRYLITFKEGAATKEASESLSARGMRIADARDFTDQAVVFEAAGDADAVVFPEINCDRQRRCRRSKWLQCRK
jgi:hypothetical protein